MKIWQLCAYSVIHRDGQRLLLPFFSLMTEPFTTLGQLVSNCFIPHKGWDQLHLLLNKSVDLEKKQLKATRKSSPDAWSWSLHGSQSNSGSLVSCSKKSFAVKGMPVLGLVCLSTSLIFSWSVYISPGLLWGFAHACISHSGVEAVFPSRSSPVAQDFLSQGPHMVSYVASAVKRGSHPCWTRMGWWGTLARWQC